VDDQRAGSALRAIRLRKRWRQKDLATKASVSPTMIVRIAHGRLAAIPLGVIRRVALALDARVDTIVRWQGGDLGRLINSRHAAMHEVMARSFATLEGWQAEPEVSFSIYGERGVIDILAWYPTCRALPVIELKTELVDINDLMGSLDRKRRLAGEIADKRGWHASSISTWVVLADGRTNRRELSDHEKVLRAKFPDDGRKVRGWLRRPGSAMNALGFLPSIHDVKLGRDLRPVRRVTRPPSAHQ